jgi:hypothetical protein
MDSTFASSPMPKKSDDSDGVQVFKDPLCTSPKGSKIIAHSFLHSSSRHLNGQDRRSKSNLFDRIVGNIKRVADQKHLR